MKWYVKPLVFGILAVALLVTLTLPIRSGPNMTALIVGGCVMVLAIVLYLWKLLRQNGEQWVKFLEEKRAQLTQMYLDRNSSQLPPGTPSGSGGPTKVKRRKPERKGGQRPAKPNAVPPEVLASLAGAAPMIVTTARPIVAEAAATALSVGGSDTVANKLAAQIAGLEREKRELEVALAAARSELSRLQGQAGEQASAASQARSQLAERDAQLAIATGEIKTWQDRVNAKHDEAHTLVRAADVAAGSAVRASHQAAEAKLAVQRELEEQRALARELREQLLKQVQLLMPIHLRYTGIKTKGDLSDLSFTKVGELLGRLASELKDVLERVVAEREQSRTECRRLSTEATEATGLQTTIQRLTSELGQAGSEALRRESALRDEHSAAVALLDGRLQSAVELARADTEAANQARQRELLALKESHQAALAEQRAVALSERSRALASRRDFVAELETALSAADGLSSLRALFASVNEEQWSRLLLALLAVEDAAAKLDPLVAELVRRTTPADDAAEDWTADASDEKLLELLVALVTGAAELGLESTMLIHKLRPNSTAFVDKLGANASIMLLLEYLCYPTKCTAILGTSSFQRYVENLPLALRAALIQTPQDPLQQLKHLLLPQRVLQALVRLNRTLRGVKFEAGDPNGLRHKRRHIEANVLPQPVADPETYRKAKRAMNVVFYLQPGNWARMLTVLADKSQRALLQEELGFDPRDLLLLIDPDLENLKALGLTALDLNLWEQFPHFEDLEQQGERTKQLSPFREAVQHLGRKLGDPASRKVQREWRRGRFDKLYARMDS